MQFTARALSDADFTSWVAKTKQSPDTLTADTYTLLKNPSDAGPVRYYGSMATTFTDIVHSSMGMEHGMSGMNMSDMEMGTTTAHQH